jgi:simple sugar transport system permease protein
MATGETLDPNGFKGIPVALLGLSNPIGIIFSALFISYIERGGYYMQMYEFVPEVIDIMVAMIIYLSAFSLMFRLMIERWNTKKRARLVEEAQEEVEA